MEVSKERMIELVKNEPEGATNWMFSDSCDIEGYMKDADAFYSSGKWWVYIDYSGDDTIKLDYSVLEYKQVSWDEYDKGMREAMKKIALIVGKKFAVDVSYQDLPDHVSEYVKGLFERIAKLTPTDDKPVYTKEMQEAGELPPVGAPFMYLADEGIKKEDGGFTSGYWDESVVIAYSDGGLFWVRGHGMQEVQTHRIQEVQAHRIKPIDHRTDQEKPIDEAAYDLYCHFTNSNAVDATCMSSYEFNMSPASSKWIAIVEKTNYRKGESNA